MIKATDQVATVQQIIQQYHSTSTNAHVQQVMTQLASCRTAALGYHVYQCSDEHCAQFKYQYHSCRNRHCPQCGALQKDEWIEDRKRELFPIPYYHVVFTLPHELNSIILGNRKELFNLLFKASAETIQCFATDKKYLGAQLGIISVLHTWGQQLSFHPHIHCIVSGGGITKKGDELEWKNGTRMKDGFLFPVKAMAIVYRAKYLQGLAQLIADKKVSVPTDMDIKPLLNTLYKKTWVVYAKKPFGGPEQVIDYLGRYTHKVAISNHRIQSIDTQNHRVLFDYKDYADGGKMKTMTLPATEFIRRFEQHILPKGLTKIRSYGYLCNRGRKQRILQINLVLKVPLHAQKVKIPWEVRLLETYNIQYNQCPHCKQLTLVLKQTDFNKKPPDDG